MLKEIIWDFSTALDDDLAGILTSIEYIPRKNIYITMNASNFDCWF